jgi:hypothetical protein
MCCYVYDPKSKLLEAEMLLPPNWIKRPFKRFQATLMQYKNMQTNLDSLNTYKYIITEHRICGLVGGVPGYR